MINVLLKKPTEASCLDFEKKVLSGTTDYYSDCDDDNLDVTYTIPDGRIEAVHAWGEQAKEALMVSDVIILD